MARTLKPCGTVAAYKRHLRAGEQPCADCLEAKRTEVAASRAEDRIPDVPVPVQSTSPGAEDLALEDELRRHISALWVAIEWAAENDPGKIATLMRERRETLGVLADLSGTESDRGGLSDFLDGSGPTGIVPLPSAKDRKHA